MTEPLRPYRFESQRDIPAHAWELDLIERFPLCLRAIHAPENYEAPIAYWGMTVAPGWQGLVEIALAVIERELQQLLATPLETLLSSTPEKLTLPDLDAQLLARLSAPRDADTPALPLVVQIKEKLGGLRLSLDRGLLCPDPAWARIRDAVERAARDSAITCARCGAPGALRQEDWLRVACDTCAGEK